MIPARKRRWFTTFFAGHARKRITQTFGRVLVAGVEELQAACARGPVIVVANHSAWWDPLVAIWLTNVVAPVDSYAMMDATNLRRLPFFGTVGAFGVDLEDPADGARAIRYAARLLDAPGRLVWVYPEGRERSPFDALELRRGAAQIARVVRGVTLVSVGVRYVFAGAEKPELWIAIGPAEPTSRDVEVGLERQRRGIEAALGRIDHALSTRVSTGFDVLAASSPGSFARLAERALSWLVRLL